MLLEDLIYKQTSFYHNSSLFYVFKTISNIYIEWYIVFNVVQIGIIFHRHLRLMLCHCTMNLPLLRKKRMKRQELKYDIIYYLGLVSSYISLLLSLYTYVWLYRYIQSTLIFVVTLLSAQNLATVSPCPVIEKGLKLRISMNSVQDLFSWTSI